MKTVQHLRCKICCCCGCFRGIHVQGGTPNSTFMTQKRADPVSCVSLAQHRLAIFTGKKTKFRQHGKRRKQVFKRRNIPLHPCGNTPYFRKPLFAEGFSRVQMCSYTCCMYLNCNNIHMLLQMRLKFPGKRL